MHSSSPAGWPNQLEEEGGSPTSAEAPLLPDSRSLGGLATDKNWEKRKREKKGENDSQEEEKKGKRRRGRGGTN